MCVWGGGVIQTKVLHKVMKCDIGEYFHADISCDKPSCFIFHSFLFCHPKAHKACVHFSNCASVSNVILITNEAYVCSESPLDCLKVQLTCMHIAQGLLHSNHVFILILHTLILQ